MRKIKFAEHLSLRTINVLAILTFILLSVSTSAQIAPPSQKNLFGVGTGVQLTSKFGISPVFNVSYERILSKHSSIESGLRYSNYKYGYGYFSENKYSNINLRYHTFTLPLLYKYNSKILYFAAGPVLSVMNRKGQFDPMSMEMQTIELPLGKLRPGAQFKIGKTINLSEKLLLEPEASVIETRYFKKPQAELNVNFKYRF